MAAVLRRRCGGALSCRLCVATGLPPALGRSFEGPRRFRGGRALTPASPKVGPGSYTASIELSLRNDQAGAIPHARQRKRSRPDLVRAVCEAGQRDGGPSHKLARELMSERPPALLRKVLRWRRPNGAPRVPPAGVAFAARSEQADLLRRIGQLTRSPSWRGADPKWRRIWSGSGPVARRTPKKVLDVSTAGRKFVACRKPAPR